MRLQRISFGRSDIPPRGRNPDSRVGSRLCTGGYGIPPLNLELRILRATELDAGSSIECRGGDEPAAPIADKDEQVIAARGIQPLDEAAPTLVATPRADADRPASLDPIGACLDLDTKKAAVQLGDQVSVGAVPDGYGELGTLTGKPRHRRQLANVPLLTPIHPPY
jgi:hypothetical protein